MVKEWIVAAAKLGIPNLRVFAGHIPEGVERDQILEWMAKDLKDCCEFGRQYGVIVAVQNHNDFLQTADDVDRIFEMVNSEWLGLNLDIGSYRLKDPYEEIKRTSTCGHLANQRECLDRWQRNSYRFCETSGIIKDSAYRGYLPIETLGAEIPIKRSLSFLKT